MVVPYCRISGDEMPPGVISRQATADARHPPPPFGVSAHSAALSQSTSAWPRGLKQKILRSAAQKGSRQPTCITNARWSPVLAFTKTQIPRPPSFSGENIFWLGRPRDDNNDASIGAGRMRL